MKHRLILKVHVLLICTLLGFMVSIQPAYAMASGSVVFDPTNWIEKVLSYIQQGQQYVVQAEDEIGTITMLENQVKALKELPDSLKGSYSSLGDIRAHLANWEAYTGALKTTIGTSKGVEKMIEGYARFASAKGVTFKQAAKFSMAAAKSGNKQARATLKADAVTIQHSNESLERLRIAAEKIKTSDPTKSQMLQTLTLQINHLIALQTKIYNGMVVNDAKNAQKRLVNTTKEQRAVVAAQHAAAAGSAYSAAQASVNAADEAQIKALQKKYPPIAGTRSTPTHSGGGNY